jgi:hypothetical protein
VNAKRCREKKSGNVEISANFEIVAVDGTNKTMGNFSFKLTMNGTTEDIQTDANGAYKKDDCVPGHAELEAVFDESYKRPEAEKYEHDGTGNTVVFSRYEEVKTANVKNWEKIIVCIKGNIKELSM